MTFVRNVRLPIFVAVLGVSGCAGGFGGQPVPFDSLAVELDRPLNIPAGKAHSKFQRGRQTSGVSRYDPWCEFEIETVSAEPQRVEPDRFVVASVNQAFIKDYNTRAPALLGGLSCDDLVFKETTWWFERGMGHSATYLRCFAPYTNCRFGPPLTVGHIQEVVGNSLRIRVDGAL